MCACFASGHVDGSGSGIGKAKTVGDGRVAHQAYAPGQPTETDLPRICTQVRAAGGACTLSGFYKDGRVEIRQKTSTA